MRPAGLSAAASLGCNKINQNHDFQFATVTRLLHIRCVYRRFTGSHWGVNRESLRGTVVWEPAKNEDKVIEELASKLSASWANIKARSRLSVLVYVADPSFAWRTTALSLTLTSTDINGKWRICNIDERDNQYYRTDILEPRTASLAQGSQSRRYAPDQVLQQRVQKREKETSCDATGR